MNYQSYLRSNHWKKLKKKKNRKKPKIYCGICASTKNIDMHHLNYRNLTDVDTTDLRRLCRRCHFLVHDLMKEGLIAFKSTSHTHRFSTINIAVRRELGILGKNMFDGSTKLDPDYRPRSRRQKLL